MPSCRNARCAYLLLLAALLSLRPAPLTVSNEPEESSHPDLITPLALLVGAVAM